MKSPCETQPPSMFTKQDPAEAKRYRLAIVGLSLLSVVALVIAVWTMIDSANEQKIVQELIGTASAECKGFSSHTCRRIEVAVQTHLAGRDQSNRNRDCFGDALASVSQFASLAIGRPSTRPQYRRQHGTSSDHHGPSRQRDQHQPTSDRVVEGRKKICWTFSRNARCVDSAKRVSASVARRWRQKFIQGFTQRIRHRKPRLSANASSVLSNAQRSGGSENG